MEPTIISTATDIVNEQIAGKPFYKSKSFWVNSIALTAMASQIHFGFIISPEIQTLALSVMNLVVRRFTKEPIVW